VAMTSDEGETSLLAVLTFVVLEVAEEDVVLRLGDDSTSDGGDDDDDDEPPKDAADIIFFRTKNLALLLPFAAEAGEGSSTVLSSRTQSHSQHQSLLLIQIIRRVLALFCRLVVVATGSLQYSSSN